MEGNLVFRWKRCTKIVGWIDIVLSVLELTIGLIFVIASIPLRGEIQEHYKAEPEAVIVLATMVILSIITSSLELWAAAKLIGSTDPGKEPSEALPMVKFWLWVNIIFLILFTLDDLLVILFMGMYWGNVIPTMSVFAIRISFIYVVWRYMKELWAASATNTGSSVEYHNL
ncbi:hypothetical protein Ocin01_12007 [Orchesella cincta]|uniref:Uncharacterized protein n=1 Tax=Orchesella cincta TaxID=48709 RepID=A0A1D2MP90_ORCCI|nr:hypothetical protein Ocin01_12007 [Orchesella cincta]